jgi:hypothetical protein
MRKGMTESRNDFLDRVIRRAIDAEFSQMANAPAYQEEALQIAEELSEVDWEALLAIERSS